MKRAPFFVILAVLAFVTWVVVGLCWFVVYPTRAHAEDMQQAQQACQDDAFKFCQPAFPDVNRVHACLKVVGRRLSPACQKFVLGDTHHVTTPTHPKHSKVKSK